MSFDKKNIKYYWMIAAIGIVLLLLVYQAVTLSHLSQRVVGFITDTSQPNIWVLRPGSHGIEDPCPFKERDFYRVRAIEGVDWAVPMYRGVIQARLSNGLFRTCTIIGIDDTSLIGGPPVMLEGHIWTVKKSACFLVAR